MPFLKTTWHHVRRSPYQALAAVLILMLTFLAVSIFTFIIVGSSKIIAYFESKPQVTAFFKDGTKQEDIFALEAGLKQSGLVSDVRYVSKEEALKVYREQNKNDPLLLDLVTADILPASLEISAVKIENLAKISQALSASPHVQEVIYQKDVVSILTSWTNALRKIGIMLIIVLSLVSVFIVVTIIGIKISQRKEEIEIMKLLGATNWYIRWPFLFEGMMYGMIGSLMSWFIATIGLLYATPNLSYFLHGIPILPVPFLFLLELLLAEVVSAMLLGMFASSLAVFRYLK